MTDSQYFESARPFLETISADKVIALSIPVDNLAFEAEHLYCAATKDQTKLTNVGLDWTYVENLPMLAGAARFTDAEYFNVRGAPQDGETDRDAAITKAMQLRETCLDYYAFAYRKNPAVLAQVREIADGTDKADHVADFDRMVSIGRQNPEELQKARFDMGLIDQCAETATRLAGIFGQSKADAADDNGTADMRNRAYTALKEAVDEVRQCGKFVFGKKPKRLREYTSDYLRKQRKKRNRKKDAGAAATTPPTTSQEQPAA
jgi:hypothetical protein